MIGLFAFSNWRLAIIRTIFTLKTAVWNQFVKNPDGRIPEGLYLLCKQFYSPAILCKSIVSKNSVWLAIHSDTVCTDVDPSLIPLYIVVPYLGTGWNEDSSPVNVSGIIRLTLPPGNHSDRLVQNGYTVLLGGWGVLLKCTSSTLSLRDGLIRYRFWNLNNLRL